jgi:hypothetical protein
VATVITCDHPDHLGEDATTKAVAYVTAVKREKEGSSTYHEQRRHDCCRDHIGFYADRVYNDNINDPLLSEIRVGIIVNKGRKL